MTKYKVLAYIGLAWLKDCGTFDTFDEAQDALLKEHDSQESNTTSDVELESDYENFLANSRIEEYEA